MSEAVLSADALPARAAASASRGPRKSADEALIRCLDVVGALGGIVFLLPLLALLAALISVLDPGPILFAQRRIGLGGKHFFVFKFRSMTVDANERLAKLLDSDPEARAEWERDHKLKRDPRVTKLGLFMRKSSLDELPQLFNVLRGEMSLVGPRPIVDSEVVRYGRYFQKYCQVRPGITGLWQIGGRNDVSYRRRVAYDVTYSRSRSLRLNIAIISLTIPSVIFARGSY